MCGIHEDLAERFVFSPGYEAAMLRVRFYLSRDVYGPEFHDWHDGKVRPVTICI